MSFRGVGGWGWPLLTTSPRSTSREPHLASHFPRTTSREPHPANHFPRTTSREPLPATHIPRTTSRLTTTTTTTTRPFDCVYESSFSHVEVLYLESLVPLVLLAVAYCGAAVRSRQRTGSRNLHVFSLFMQGLTFVLPVISRSICQVRGGIECGARLAPTWKHALVTAGFARLPPCPKLGSVQSPARFT